MQQNPILVICPASFDRRNLTRPSVKLPIIFDDYTSFDLEKFTYEEGSEEAKVDEMVPLIEHLIQKYEKVKLGGIITSDDYPGSLIASIFAKRRGLRAPSIESLLLCQHKYYSRVKQKESIPEAVPEFALVHPQDYQIGPFPLPFPCFVKPVKSYLSCYAGVLHSQEDLAHCSLPCPAFLKPLNEFMRQYSNLDTSADYLIAEELLDGVQATIDGYVYNGDCQFFGVVDSLMYPGTICFERFEYPSTLPEEAIGGIEELVRRFIKHIGFDNGLFNVEFFYNAAKKSLHIIEVNPRMASQFADLYEKVDGTNSYDVALAIAQGLPPRTQKAKGLYRVAASFVLREFANKTVEKIPSLAAIQELEQRFPQTIVQPLCREGRRLSEELQDGKSYRYALIHLGANSRPELEAKFHDCKNSLDFKLVAISAP